MTPELKKRIAHEISNFRNASQTSDASLCFLTADRMAALLQELIDADKRFNVLVKDAERYRWLRDNMEFDYSADGRHAMKLARPLPAPWHNFNTGWIAHLFMPCVDKTVDAAIAAEKGGEA